MRSCPRRHSVARPARFHRDQRQFCPFSASCPPFGTPYPPWNAYRSTESPKRSIIAANPSSPHAMILIVDRLVAWLDESFCHLSRLFCIVSFAYLLPVSFPICHHLTLKGSLNPCLRRIVWDCCSSQPNHGLLRGSKSIHSGFGYAHSDALRLHVHH